MRCYRRAMLRLHRIAIALVFLPFFAVASPTPPAPILVDEAPATAAPAASPATKPQGPLVLNFPEAAVTRIGENTSGEYNDAPADAPHAPAAPAAPPASTPSTPPSPASPPSPISKLWPRDTIPIFLRSCTGFHPELVPPCTCVITNLMDQMGHDEFLKLSEANTIEQDARLIAIRQQCVTAPKRKE